MRSAESWDLRCRVLAKYGSVCTCLGCGCDIPEFLTLDHIHGDGEHERKLSKKRGSAFYRVLLNEPRRSDLRILCSNCHLAVTWGDLCPHQRILASPQPSGQKPWDITEHASAIQSLIRREIDGGLSRGVAPAIHALQSRLDAAEQRLPPVRTPRPWRWSAVALVLVGLVSAMVSWSWW